MPWAATVGFRERGYGVNDQDLEFFIVAGRCQSFSEAASRLYVSPASISRGISKLESELGFQLFNRSGRTLQLTDPGKVFLEGVVNIREQFRSLVGEARGIAGLDAGTLSIGVLEGQMLDPMTSAAFGTLRACYPSVDISLCRLSYGEILSSLDSFEIDVVLAIDLCFENQKSLQVLPICELPTHIVVPQDHPLACSKDSCLADFASDVFISCSDAPGEKYVRSVFEGCETIPEVVLAPDMETEILWVESCRGLAFSNPYNMMSNSPALTEVYPRDLGPRSFAAAWRQDNPNTLVELFVSILKRRMEE